MFFSFSFSLKALTKMVEQRKEVDNMLWKKACPITAMFCIRGRRALKLFWGKCGKAGVFLKSSNHFHIIIIIVTASIIFVITVIFFIPNFRLWRPETKFWPKTTVALCKCVVIIIIFSWICGKYLRCDSRLCGCYCTVWIWIVFQRYMPEKYSFSCGKSGSEKLTGGGWIVGSMADRALEKEGSTTRQVL